MEIKSKEKSCCIIGHTIFVNESDYKPILKSEIMRLIEQGYTNFITYYWPDINEAVIHIVSELHDLYDIPLSVEFIFINSGLLKYMSRKRIRYYQNILSLCGKITVLVNDNDNPNGVKRLKNYLLEKCDMLLCIEEEFSCEMGKRNFSFLTAFIDNNLHTRLLKLPYNERNIIDFKNLNKTQTCCFIGSIYIKPKEIPLLQNIIKETVEMLINDNNVNLFWFGVNRGFERAAFQTVYSLKEKYPHIKLHIALHGREYADITDEMSKKAYEMVLAQADEVIHAGYFKPYLNTRNDFMIHQSSHFVCCLRSFSAETSGAVKSARKEGLTIYNVYEDSKYIAAHNNS